MKKIFIIICLLFFIITPFIFFSPSDVFAQTTLVNPIGGTVSDPVGVIDQRVIIGNVVSKLLGLIGSLTLVVFVIGGFMWITAGGKEEQIKQGTMTMLYAVIGIFVIFSSYVILNLFIKTLTG